MQYKKGGKPINRKSIIGLIVLLPLLAFAVALNSSKAWDARVELPFVYLTVAPTVVLAGMTLLESYKQKEENKILMGFLAILAGTVTSLTVIILLGRIGDIGNYAFLHVLGQSLQAIALSAYLTRDNRHKRAEDCGAERILDHFKSLINFYMGYHPVSILTKKAPM